VGVLCVGLPCAGVPTARAQADASSREQTDPLAPVSADTTAADVDVDAAFRKIVPERQGAAEQIPPPPPAAVTATDTITATGSASIAGRHRATSAQPNAGPKSLVTWSERDSWPEVVGRAQAAGRPILIDFYAEWCRPCKQLDRQVYSDPVVAAKLADLVTYKVDVDMPDGIVLGQQFHVYSLPTIILCRPDGEEIDRFRGYRPPDKFLQLIDDIRAGRGTLEDLELKLLGRYYDPQLRLAVGLKHAERMDVAPARRYLGAALDRGDALPRRDQARALLALANLEYHAGNEDRAVALANRVLRDYADDIDFKRTLRALARYQRERGDVEAPLSAREADADPRRSRRRLTSGPDCCERNRLLRAEPTTASGVDCWAGEPPAGVTTIPTEIGRPKTRPIKRHRPR
jgi:thioredoxin-like negative regulator of GroEL